MRARKVCQAMQADVPFPEGKGGSAHCTAARKHKIEHGTAKVAH